MKKLTCILLVTMFTMTSMVFAQKDPGPSELVVDYITITNTTTKESKTIPTNQFTSDGNNQYSYDVDFCLGVYNGDKIEVSYIVRTISNPNVTWSYSWENSSSGNLGTGLTENFLVENAPYDKSVLKITCNVLKGETSKSYNIRFKNVHNAERIKVTTSNATKEVLIAYAYYDELLSCAKQGAVAYLYNTESSIPISSYRFDRIGDIGRAVLSTGNKSGFYIVNVTVNDKIIFTRTIFVQ